MGDWDALDIALILAMIGAVTLCGAFVLVVLGAAGVLT